MSLNLSDRVVDIVNEGVDCAVRVGDLPDSQPGQRAAGRQPAAVRRDAGVPEARRHAAASRANWRGTNA